MIIVLSGLLAIIFDGDHHFGALLRADIKDGICPVHQQIVGINNTVHSLPGLTKSRCGNFCNKHSDRHTLHIHGQMYLSVEPLFYDPWPSYHQLHRQRADEP
jgi:hypothetical protein